MAMIRGPRRTRKGERDKRDNLWRSLSLILWLCELKTDQTFGSDLALLIWAHKQFW